MNDHLIFHFFKKEIFWNTILKEECIKKFGKVTFKQTELKGNGNVKKLILSSPLSSTITINSYATLYNRVAYFTGFKVLPSLQKDINKNLDFFLSRITPFEFLQVLDLGEKISYTDVTYRCQAMYCLKKGLSLCPFPQVELFQKKEKKSYF